MASEHVIMNEIIAQAPLVRAAVEEKKDLTETVKPYDIITGKGRKTVTLKSILSYSSLKVQIHFPTGEVEVKSFREFREYLLSIKDISICADLIRYGEVTKDALRYSLINT